VTDDRYLWPRTTLALMSVGFALVAGVAIFGSMMAIDPEDKLPRAFILVPGAMALVGITLAAFGGLLSRIASGVFGLLIVVVGFLIVAEGLSSLVRRAPQDWLPSHLDLGLGAIVGAAIALGLAAVVASVRVGMKANVGGESPS
jgi:hypothetical protein